MIDFMLDGEGDLIVEDHTIKMSETDNDYLIRLFSSSDWWGSSLLDAGEVELWVDIDTGTVTNKKQKSEIEAKIKKALDGRDIDFEWSGDKLIFKQK